MGEVHRTHARMRSRGDLPFHDRWPASLQVRQTSHARYMYTDQMTIHASRISPRHQSCHIAPTQWHCLLVGRLQTMLLGWRCISTKLQHQACALTRP